MTVLVRVLEPADDELVYDSTLPLEDVHEDGGRGAVFDARFFWQE